MAASPSPRRHGWPWPTTPPEQAPPDDADLLESEALVRAEALTVARLTGELHMALRRLEDAQLEARIAGECVAARQAVAAISRARTRSD